MKFPRLFGAGILVLLNLNACREPEIESRNAIEFPADFPPIAYQNPENPFTEAHIALGRKLFYDPNLSLTRNISCGSCHAQVHGFADHNTPQSFGIFGRKGVRNSPALINLAWMNEFMWDGGIRHLDVMPIAPITDTTEMGLSLPLLINRVEENISYNTFFQQAYGTTQVNEKRILYALSQFMLSLISDGSKYDRVRRNQDKFSLQEQKGYSLFKEYCVNCHQEPLLTDVTFQRNGITKEGPDLGRFRITQMPKDSFYFKVPTLRNVALTYPYFHDGRFQNLEEVLDAYNHADRTLSSGLPSFNLDNSQKQELISFLNTLTDYSFISNHQFSEPR